MIGTAARIARVVASARPVRRSRRVRWEPSRAPLARSLPVRIAVAVAAVIVAAAVAASAVAVAAVSAAVAAVVVAAASAGPRAPWWW